MGSLHCRLADPEAPRQITSVELSAGSCISGFILVEYAGRYTGKYAASRLVGYFVSFALRVISNVQGGVVGRRHNEGAIEERGHGMWATCDDPIGVLYIVVAGSTVSVVVASAVTVAVGGRIA